jgi:hypothetical protein
MWAKQSTAATLIVGPILDSSGAEFTTAVIGDLSISKNGGTLTAMASAATLTHIANGQYTLVTTTGNLDTLGRAQITCNKSTYQMPTVNLMVVPANVFDSMVLGTDALDVSAIQFAGQTITAAAGVTVPSSIASPTNITAATGVVLSGVTHTGAVIPTVSTVTNGVTVSTNNDKTGYTASTVTDKTGYSLSQAFPSNFASLGINASGHVSRVTLVDTTTTNTDMRGTDSAALASAWTATRAGYLDGVLLAANYNQRTVSVTGSNHVAADIHELQAGVITAGKFAAGAIDANALAADAALEIVEDILQADLAGYAVDSNIATTIYRLFVMTEADGADFRFTTKALEQAPAGGGGGGTDWTANERTAIRSILGIPGSGTTPTDPTVGILDEIRDKTALITTGTIASSIPVTASGQIDGPLVIGDDYLSANGRAFTWTVALPSAFVIATSTCKFGMQYQDEDGTYSFNVAGTVTDAGSGNVTLTFDVPKATTGTLGPGWYRWSVEIASASGTEVTRVKSSHNKLVEWVEKQT